MLQAHSRTVPFGWVPPTQGCPVLRGPLSLDDCREERPPDTPPRAVGPVPSGCHPRGCLRVKDVAWAVGGGGLSPPGSPFGLGEVGGGVCVCGCDAMTSPPQLPIGCPADDVIPLLPFFFPPRRDAAFPRRRAARSLPTATRPRPAGRGETPLCHLGTLRGATRVRWVVTLKKRLLVLI